MSFRQSFLSLLLNRASFFSAIGIFVLSCAAPVNFAQKSENSQSQVVSVYPETIDFQRKILESSNTQSISVTNTTSKTVDLTFDAGSYTHFSLDHASCLQLAPRASCQIIVRFNPKRALKERFSLHIGAQTRSERAQPVVKEGHDVQIAGEGFFIAPSAGDQAALVGWYSARMTQKITFDNTIAPNRSCPLVSEVHGSEAMYCYEPSGAHGMVLGNSNGEFGKLKKYILDQPNTVFKSVPTLDDLFADAPHESDNMCFKEALFYYALSYLIIPNSEPVEHPDWDPLEFTVTDVDDGLQIISNGLIAGRVSLQIGPTVKFSLHRGSQNKHAALKRGVNEIAAIWLDDCAVYRDIKGAGILYKGQPVQAILPNVLRGYLYDKETGRVFGAANLDLEAKVNGVTTHITGRTDVSGFYLLQSIPDGDHMMTVTLPDGRVFRERVKFDHSTADKAVVEFSNGY